MAKFYFDIDNGFVSLRDDEGIDLASIEDVPMEALAVLRDLANIGSLLARPVMSAVVRDATGAPIIRATLTAAVERVG